MVDAADMRAHILNICEGCFLVHENNNLFVRRALSDHVDVRFGFALTAIDDLLDLINFVVLEFWKYLFDLESVHHCIEVLGFRRSLGI